MYKMRESWPDERLDDFRDEVNKRFDRIDERLGSMQHLIVYAVVGIATLVLAGYAALAALIATQL